MKIKKLFDDYGIVIPVIVLLITMFVRIISYGMVDIVVILINNIFLYLVTFQFAPSIFMHSIGRKNVAKYIGWESSRFQYLIAGYSLSMAILGVVCNYFQGVFWVVTTVAVTIFLWPCAIGHIVEMVKSKNFKAGNAGYIFYWDVFMPLSLIILLTIHFNF